MTDQILLKVLKIWPLISCTRRILDLYFLSLVRDSSEIQKKKTFLSGSVGGISYIFYPVQMQPIVFEYFMNLAHFPYFMSFQTLRLVPIPWDRKSKSSKNLALS